MGIKQMGVTAGSALSAVILVVFAENYGWRPTVIGVSILLLMVGVLTHARYRDSQQAKNEQQKHIRYKDLKQSLFEIAKNKTLS